MSPKLKAPPERVHRSGHCARTNPPHVHDRCRGAYSGARCPCECHAEPEPVPVPSLLADGSTRCPLCGSPWTPLSAGGASAKW